jgi:hypothetical protein
LCQWWCTAVMTVVIEHDDLTMQWGMGKGGRWADDLHQAA